MDENNLAGGSWIWVIVVFALLFGGGGLLGGNRGPEYATADQVNQGFNNQNMQNILLSSANNNYEMARLIDAQTNTYLQQNNANQINVLQGFNAINLQLQAMSSKMDDCCCKIQTTILQNRYEDERAKNVALQNEISNFQQSQYILGQMGRWVAWVGNGSQAAVAASA